MPVAGRPAVVLLVAGLMLAVCLAGLCGAAEGNSGGGARQVIFDMETVRHRPGEVKKGEQNVPVGKAELVEGKFGKAVRFSFEDGWGPGFMTASAAGTSEWDKADGFSFYVQGDARRTGVALS